MKINYLNGDATSPQTPGNKIIVHVCNDVGDWGKGFLTAVSKRWKTPELQYREWYNSGGNFSLGQVQFVRVAGELWVANLIGQHDITKDKHGNPPIRYEAIAGGLDKVAAFASKNKATIHMPRIGCGLAGGTWDKIEPLLKRSLSENGIETFVYDFD